MIRRAPALPALRCLLRLATRPAWPRRRVARAIRGPDAGRFRLRRAGCLVLLALLIRVATAAAGLPQLERADAPAPGIAIPFALDHGGQVSLAVYNASGQLVRTLLCGVQQPAGEHQVRWDGLDRYGQAQPPGQYAWRLLRTPGFSREFLVNLGIQTPWTPFGVWPGNHFGPNHVRVDDDGALYVGAISSEGPPNLLKMPLDGGEPFWTAGQLTGLRGMARIGEVLYVLVDTGLETCGVDNGKETRKGIMRGRRYGKGWTPFFDLLHAGDDRAQKKVSPMKLAGGRDFLVVTYQDYNELRVLWPKDNAIARDQTFAVNKPVSAAVAADGRLFVVSGDKIVRLDAETGATTLVVPHVPAPGNLAYDPVFDDLLVVSAGKCIRRYHAGDGQAIAVYGRPDGRIYGRFNPLDFDDILDLAADGQGGFVMVEQYPRRVAHFRGREAHSLVNQWIGGLQWGAVCAIDPADPSIAYIPIDPKHLGRGKMDFATHTWSLTHLYDMPPEFSWTVGKSDHRAILPPLTGTSYWNVVHRAGHTFLVNHGRQQGGGCTIVKVDNAADQLIPVAHIGGLHPTLISTDPPAWWSAARQRSGTTASCFSWSDVNHNGQVEASEIKLGSRGVQSHYAVGHSFVDDRWNVYLVSAGKTPWMIVPNTGSLEFPAWDWDRARSADARYDPMDYAQATPRPSGIWRDKQGGMYLLANGRGDEYDVPPLTWPNNASHSNRFMKWESSHSAPVFTVGRHTARLDAPPGEFASIRAILGEVNDCLVVMDARSPASIWTRDGLYAGAFNDDAGLDIPINASTLPGEKLTWQDLAYRKIAHGDNQWGQVCQTAAGEVLWGALRLNSTALYRVTGWEGWERLHGQVTLTESTPAARRKGTGLKGVYYAADAAKPSLVRIDPAIWLGPMWGDHREVEPKYPWFQTNARQPVDPATCLVRWTGFLEPPTSEDFKFHIYTYGRDVRDRKGKPTGNCDGAKVRLWLDDRLVIDSWDTVTPTTVQGFVRTRRVSSAAVPLRAAKLVPIKLEYSAAGEKDAHLHLYWESDSADLRHVPTSALYARPLQDKPSAAD